MSEPPWLFFVVTFSNRCTLKNIAVKDDVPVIQLNDVQKTISSIIKKNNQTILDNEQIEKLYNILLPYTMVDEDVKRKHIKNIKNNSSNLTD